MKYVIYTGVLFMPDRNAAAQRALAISKIVSSIGYQPVVIGMRPNEHVNNVIQTERELEGIKLFEMGYPQNSFDWLKMLFDYKQIIQVIEYLGKEKCQAVIAMDYFVPALYSLIKFCNGQNIRLILDTVDWFGNSSYRFPKGMIKNLDTFLRMHYLNKKTEYLITISSFLENYYKNSVKNVVRIPGIYCSLDYNNNQIFETNSIRTISFVGAPGKKCDKEKIDWVIKAICKNNEENKKMKFIIAGIDKETLAVNRPDLVSIRGFDESIVCKGRISHDMCKELIRTSDFTVIIRENSRLSNAGFPTKLGESYAYGTPVIVTPTSDIRDYVFDGYGIVTNSCTYEEVEKVIHQIANMTDEQVLYMHNTVKKYNPLNYTLFIDKLRSVIDG